MFTYSLWKGLFDEITIYSSNLDIMFCYSIGSFATIFAIALYLISSPFQLTGLIIWLITRRKYHDK